MVFCSKCGNEESDEKPFCSKCGTPIILDVSEKPKKKGRSKKKKLLKLQLNYREQLDETDRTLESIHDKEVCESIKSYLFLNPQQNLEHYLSSLKPIDSKLRIQKSKQVLKILDE